MFVVQVFATPFDNRGVALFAFLLCTSASLPVCYALCVA